MRRLRRGIFTQPVYYRIYLSVPCSVVFSFWTYTLDLIESLLKSTTISYVRIDGNLSGSRREQAIQKFQTDNFVRIILVSITCGGTGYALQSLLESAYSPHALGGLLTGTQSRSHGRLASISPRTSVESHDRRTGTFPHPSPGSDEGGKDYQISCSRVI